MRIEERRKKLGYAEKMEEQTARRIFRLNTALKSWRRRVKMHQEALAREQQEVLLTRIADLESKIGKPGSAKRAVQMEGD